MKPEDAEFVPEVVVATDTKMVVYGKNDFFDGDSDPAVDSETGSATIDLEAMVLEH